MTIMKCIKARCFSPLACSAFGYCRDLNIKFGMPNEATASEWRANNGTQPDPRIAAMVALAAELHERYGDYELGDL